MDWLLVLSVIVSVQGASASETVDMRVVAVLASRDACRREASAAWHDVRARPGRYMDRAQALLAGRKGQIDFEMVCINGAGRDPL